MQHRTVGCRRPTGCGDREIGRRGGRGGREWLMQKERNWQRGKGVPLQALGEVVVRSIAVNRPSHHAAVTLVSPGHHGF